MNMGAANRSLPMCEAHHTLFEFFQGNRLFLRIADPAIHGIRNDNRFINVIFALVHAQNKRRCFDMVLANRPAAKTTCGMCGTFTVDTVHSQLILFNSMISPYAVYSLATELTEKKTHCTLWSLWLMQIHYDA